MEIHNDLHQHADIGDSKILFRAPQEAGGKRWAINIHKTSQDINNTQVLQNLGTACTCTCLLAGARVLLADGATLAVESFVGGEVVRTLSGVAKVLKPEQVVLGYTRKIIELVTPDGENLFLTDDHPLWTRLVDGSEWWGTYNFNQYLVEKSVGLGTRLKTDAIPLRFDIPQTIAHVTGWRHVQPIFHMMPPETPVYHIAVEEGGSYIANGFVVTSYCRDEDVKDVRWKAIQSDISIEQRVRECCGVA